MGFETPPKMPTPEELAANKKEQEERRVKVGGFESPDNLRIKKREDMTPEEIEEERKKENDLRFRPAVRI